jgi:hypothetical protein
MRINLEQVISQANLDRYEVARQLYPDVLYPMQSMSRVLRGESQLNEEQIFKLAMIVGCEVSDLYNFEGWNYTGVDKKVHMFSKNDGWTATYNSHTNVTRLYCNTSLKATLILSSKAVSVTELYQKLNDTIKQF